jgi:polyferredoxin
MNSQDNFRDHIATVDESGKRKWIYPKKPKGTFYNARTLVAVVLLAFLFSGPFITIDGQPILLLNLIERKFIIFGLAFWPQDFHLFLLLMVSFLLMIVTFTSIFGRIWCGWACPQTIFMELVFRKIEYWIEGDAAAQKKLDDGKGSNYVLKKGAKHLIFYLLSFLIANTFLAYVIGIDALYKIISEPISEHVSGFVALKIFTLLFYGVFARFRE